MRMKLTLVALFAATMLVGEAEAKKPAHQQRWQYQYQEWLPSVWHRLAQCETGVNWEHANSQYVSAFGIQRGSHNGAYDSDARYARMPPWNDLRPPTPWQQYRTALAHYRRFGGFSGWGCRGA